MVLLGLKERSFSSAEWAFRLACLGYIVMMDCMKENDNEVQLAGFTKGKITKNETELLYSMTAFFRKTFSVLQRCSDMSNITHHPFCMLH